MTYYEFAENVLQHFRVSKEIETIKIEQDLETNELLAVAYEAAKSLIIVATYKQQPDIDMPLIQGWSALDKIKDVIAWDKSKMNKSSVKFKEKDGISTDTIFKIDTASFATKNVASTLLPDTPRKLSGFTPDFSVDLTTEDLQQILKYLSVNSMFNPVIFLTKNKKGKLEFKLDDSVSILEYATNYDVPDGILDTPFKLDLERLLTILRKGVDGINLSIAEAQNLVRLIKDTEEAEFQYFLIKKAI